MNLVLHPSCRATRQSWLLDRNCQMTILGEIGVKNVGDGKVGSELNHTKKDLQKYQ